MLYRTLSSTVARVSQSFPVLMITGPRQVGKTTLLEICATEESAKGRRYVTLDDLDARTLAQQDPALFLQRWAPPVTIDEIQYAPQLFSAIKIEVDRRKTNGLFWLTGSQKFELMRGLTESLAGRVAILDLLGLSQAELEQRARQSSPFLPTAQWIESAREHAARSSVTDTFKRIWLGGYPRLVTQGEGMRDIFYRSYVQTYIQRDVQDILKISDQTVFNRFIAAVAARTGQLLNYANLARDVGIEQATAKSWISILETSGLVFLLKPYASNRTTRLVKSPKMYMLDTGLAAYLTRWPSAESLEASAMSGAMLETWVVSEVLKSYWHHGQEAPLFYYRDVDQQEIDLLIESGDTLYPVEIKKTATPSSRDSRLFRVIDKLGKKAGQGALMCFVEKDIPIHRDCTAIPVGYL